MRQVSVVGSAAALTDLSRRLGCGRAATVVMCHSHVCTEAASEDSPGASLGCLDALACLDTEAAGGCACWQSGLVQHADRDCCSTLWQQWRATSVQAVPWQSSMTSICCWPGAGTPKQQQLQACTKRLHLLGCPGLTCSLVSSPLPPSCPRSNVNIPNVRQ